ncbi:type 1 glutamine amidotransferase [Rhodovulum sp. BSW8]|uniref:GMP synthase-like glutamine amidotransferase n=1 Tax=Rhodovulum visakhapatnamense TaxID=364297 RepID=A0A4R8FZB0_9RHOB|nr:MULTISPECIES: type 1 glutamine amidotransferase [Rhodovulum]OLS45851.1 glutamine amidotransferase [Rhodovulum sulfidophilum]MBL3569276.1 type 1 glutamine amidotransferase [Rhodovulum visakhapatnamense]MBL3577247.1 type 1 glutamine amidotransferase [Rhodovulum visakhapatnamense]RBO51551.1 type 1 glutamine amidotransferase [Rhodovulum sp. BSW8]TDX29613.1 GMP synthase-like glutamine amidotransferase [Rhodovulum visakhapatnamense]
MQIGILQTGHAPDALRAAHGDYPDMFVRLLEGHGFTFHTWPVLDMQFPPSIHAAEGWLITGSRFGAYEDHAFIHPLEEFIRQAYSGGVPLVGICFGHQIIAQALGGRVEKFAGGWSVGPRDYRIEGQDYRLNAWHQDQVVEPPHDAETVGSAPGCAHAALIYGEHAYTVQPHPEFAPAFEKGLIEERGPGVVPDETLAEARARLDLPTDSAAMAARIARFFTERR